MSKTEKMSLKSRENLNKKIKMIEAIKEQRKEFNSLLEVEKNNLRILQDKIFTIERYIGECNFIINTQSEDLS